ncbi:MAG: O-antigen ligase family protein [Acidobacteriota bacterium]|nr:O-antigen ligase family protein [Blastocatellia bacterium]MDW8238660.1 O-antigen ligase family protein [Acidobacteriota bacterium]
MATATSSLSVQMEAARGRLPTYLVVLLSVQVFCTFLTETKFIAELKNNIGAFEVSGLILFVVAFDYFLHQQLPIRTHPVMRWLGVMALVATLSLLQLTPDRQWNGIVAYVLLLSSLAFTLTLYNVITLHEQYFVRLMRAIGYAVGVIALWLLADSIQSGGQVNAAGPFRNRAHASVYMFTSFWILLLNLSWPGTTRRQWWTFTAILPLALYCVMVGGRRSVYLSLLVGLVGLALGFIVSRARAQFKLLTPFVVSLIAVGLFYFVLSEFWYPAQFFRQRVGMVSSRIEMATARSAEDVENDFMLQQRAGVLDAFRDHPVLGIGWGGFYRSVYSRTGHEVHSTPMRFLAETGLLGLLAYTMFMGCLLWRSLRLWWLSRRSDFELSSLILCLALWSLSVSYVYNRQMTDRTFWLMLVVFISYETIVLNRHRRARWFREQAV